jgi:hypothetical protein
MPGLYKIGMTDKDDLAVRMKELHTTGVPLPFDCVYACVVEDNAKTEKTMHAKFAKQRVNPRREFFKLKPFRIVEALKQFEIKDVTVGFREDFDSFFTDEEKSARWEARHALERINPDVAEAKDLHSSVKKALPRQK